MKTLARVTLFTLALLTPAVMRAQGRTPEQLASALVDAMRANDEAAINALQHPSMHNCATLNDPKYVARLRQVRESSRPKINGPYKVRLFAVSDSMNAPIAYETVRPTQQLDISFDGTDFSLLRRIAQSGNDWFIVMPCFR
ncbi:MAG: hypothetical protein ACJ796_14635 [Gemmatimonadaceae bacterium]